MSFFENQMNITRLRIYLFNKYLCDTYDIPGSILGTEETTIKRLKRNRAISTQNGQGH